MTTRHSSFSVCRRQSLRGLVPALLAVILTACTWGCRKPEPPPPTWVAMVESTPIEPSQVYQAWQRRQRGNMTNLTAQTLLVELVDEIAAFEQARRAGFLDRPEIQAAIRQLVVAKYREAQQTNNPTPIEPSEADLRDIYAQKTNLFVRPPALNLAIIQHEVPRTATPEKRLEASQAVIAWRREILAAPDPAKAFGTLAAERSADRATRYHRGELGWLTLDELRQRVGPEVVAAVDGLAVGAVAEPVEAPGSVFLVRLIGRRPAEVKPFAEMEPLLRYQVREERRTKAEAGFRAASRSGLTIRTNEALLATLALTNRPALSPPPNMPKN